MTYLANRRKAFRGDSPPYFYNHAWLGSADIQSNQAEFPDDGGPADRVVVTDVKTRIENIIKGSADCTVELEVHADVSQNQCYFGLGNGVGGWPPGTPAGHLFIMCQEGGDTKVQWNNGPSLAQIVGSGTIFTTAGRFIYVRDSGRVSIYKDANRLATTTSNIEVQKQATAGVTTINIGGNAVNGEDINGRIDVLAISDIARYDATLSVITPRALTDDANTIYLNTFSGANGSTPLLNTLT